MKTLPVKHRLPDLTSCNMRNHSQKILTKNQNFSFCLLSYEKKKKKNLKEAPHSTFSTLYRETALSGFVTILWYHGEFEESICGTCVVFFLSICIPVCTEHCCCCGVLFHIDNLKMPGKCNLCVQML